MLYKSIAFANSPFHLTSADIDAINANQNSLIMDCDLTLDVTLNLPSINSLLFGSNTNASTVSGVGGGGMSFYIKGNINRGANNLRIVPASGDDICGVSSATIAGLGSCFHLFISGIHRWGLLTCVGEGGGGGACFALGLTNNFVVLTGGALTVGTPNQPILTGNVGENTLTITGAFVFGAGSNTSGLTAGSPQILDAITLKNALIAAGTAGQNLGGGAVNLGTINAGGGNYAAGSFTAGAYKAGGAFNTNANGIITLNGDGCYVFYANGAFTTGANTTILLINGAVASKVFFVSTGALSTGDGTIFKGTFVSAAGFTTGVNLNLEGRLISAGAAAGTLGAGANIFQLPTA